MEILDEKIKVILSEYAEKLENFFDADVIYYWGPIINNVHISFRKFIEHVYQNGKFINNKNGVQKKRLVFLLTTLGGSVETTEAIVNLTRFYYEEIYFIVPSYAMSAGTVLCMSGDKIFMDYSSCLGPIDPQVYSASQNSWVPAAGYLEKCQQFCEKSLKGELSNAELFLLKEVDLAFLSQCEHASELARSLIKDWLPLYLLKNESNSQDKIRSIANKLSDVEIWHSHGRFISIEKLKSIVELPIQDYTQNKELRNLVVEYGDFLLQYLNMRNMTLFLHSRTYFQFWRSK